MPLDIPCPHCDRHISVPNDYLGAGVRCPHCDVVFAVQQTAVTTALPPDDGRLPYELVGPLKVKKRTLPRSARYQPGRGKLLLALGVTSLGLSMLGMIAAALLPATTPLFGLLAFALGLPAWIMGQHDMEKVRRAVIDPYAEKLTSLGWVSGIVGTLVAVLMMVCGLGGLYLLLLSRAAN
jgi:hypothetical protein